MTNIQKIIKIFAFILAGFIIINIISLILFILSIFFNKRIDNNEDLTTKIISQNVKRIEVDLAASNLEIMRGEEFKIETNNSNIKIKEKKHMIELEEKESNFLIKKASGSVIITIPQSVNLSAVSLDISGGNIILDDLVSEKLELDLGAGNVQISDSSFNNTKIDGGAGKIKIENSTLNNLDLDAGVGKIDITANILGRSKIDCGVGEMNLNLQGNKDTYTINASKGIGNIKIDSVNQSNDSRIGNGVNIININGGVGSINVQFDK